MKNYWLERRNTNCLFQIAGSTSNLDIFYQYQFCENEFIKAEIAFDMMQSFLKFEKFKHFGVIAETITGTVFYKKKAFQTFVCNKHGYGSWTSSDWVKSEYLSEDLNLPIINRIDFSNIYGCMLMDFNESIALEDVKLVCSYEYDSIEDTNRQSADKI